MCSLYILPISWSVQEFLLVSRHCLSWALQTRSSFPVRKAGNKTGNYINDWYTPHLQVGTDGCLVASMRRRKRQTPEMHKNCERAMPWHLTKEGEVHNRKNIGGFRAITSSRCEGMTPAWTGLDSSCWCWPATDTRATRSGATQTHPCYTGTSPFIRNVATGLSVLDSYFVAKVKLIINITNHLAQLRGLPYQQRWKTGGDRVQ